MTPSLKRARKTSLKVMRMKKMKNLKKVSPVRRANCQPRKIILHSLEE